MLFLVLLFHSKDPKFAEFRIKTVKFQTFHIASMKTSVDLQEALDEIRAVTDSCTVGAPCFAFALDYLIWDSFALVLILTLTLTLAMALTLTFTLKVLPEMTRNLFISCICVFFVLVLLLHPVLSLLVVFVIVIMDILILAWIPLMGLELNSVRLGPSLIVDGAKTKTKD